MNNNLKTDILSRIDVEEYDLLYEENQEEITRVQIPKLVSEELEQCALEAFYNSLRNFGEIRPVYMMNLTGASWKELEQCLAGKVMWQNPEDYDRNPDEMTGWKTEAQYARGNYNRLRRTAEAMNEKYEGRFEENLRLLDRRRPEQTKPSRFILGDNRIPLYFYSRFIYEHLGMVRRPKIRHSLGKIITEKESNLTFDREKNERMYGTERVTAYRIWQMTLNGQLAEASKLDPVTGNWIPDLEGTIVAQEQQQNMIRAFENWVYEDPEVLERLTEALEEELCYLEEKYDGSYLKLPDLNPEIQLRDHQNNAIARTIQSNSNLVYAHSVGAGKRYIMIVSAHELKRMHLSSKNLMVIPNNVLEATVRDHHYLYPNDRILKIAPSDFRPKDREEVLRRIREEDYTAIYIAMTCFDMIRNSHEYYVEKTHREIQQCKAALNRTTMEEEKTYLKRTLTRLSEQYKELLGRYSRKPTECYEHLGITTLFVDECHNYKNITLHCSTEHVVGLHTKGSARCDNMYEKAVCTPRKIFATGTPLMNSMTDLYVLQKFLQPEALEFCKISRFNEWLKTFCEYQTTYEVDVDGCHGRTITRLSRFHDLPQLMAMFRTVCDFYEVDEKELDLPQFDGYQDIVVKKSPQLEAAMLELADRAEQLRSRNVTRDTDNLLKITMDGRKCALDLRLLYPDAQVDDETTRAAACANQVLEIYGKYPGNTQIVFCDFSVPKKTFNIYDELKKLLIRRGIPEWEIAFIHDGNTEEEREQLLQLLNDGKIRVMIGSTQKLGVGVNAQENMIAIHHLDAPWRPGDLVQREGRLRRQGNRNRKVFIYRYVTEGSFDAYIWQVLENKQRFICDFVAGRLSRHHCEEDNIDEIILSYAEIKALAIGNMLIKKRMELSNQLERTKILYRRRNAEISRFRDQAYTLPEEISRYHRLIKLSGQDWKHYCRQKQEMDPEDRAVLGEELLLSLKENEMQEKERLFDWYQGFEVILPKGMKAEKPYVLLRKKNGGTYSVEMEHAMDTECCDRLDFVLNHLQDCYREYREKHSKLTGTLEQAKQELRKGNEYEPRIEEMEMMLAQMDEELKSA